MNRVLLTADEVSAQIRQGDRLFLAADEQMLAQLPPGEWIGGTIPYFMGERGGEFTQERIYVTTLPPTVSSAAIQYYDQHTIKQVFAQMPPHGVGLIVIPASSPTHFTFALNAPHFEGFALRPLLGWITGVPLDALGRLAPKIFDGRAGRAYEDGALVLNFGLPPHQEAEINILNIFQPGDGDVITFDEDAFQVQTARINGEPRQFADYLEHHGLDLRLPLVADYHGAMINTSFQTIDQPGRAVSFYAPVFKGIAYRHARPVADYVSEFLSRVSQQEAHEVFFACNCILNYLHSELEGKQTGSMTGPMTFGEIAYQLVNQTLVYLTILDVSPA